MCNGTLHWGWVSYLMPLCGEELLVSSKILSLNEVRIYGDILYVDLYMYH